MISHQKSEIGYNSVTVLVSSKIHSDNSTQIDSTEQTQLLA
jgi:hypothetical protein